STETLSPAGVTAEVVAKLSQEPLKANVADTNAQKKRGPLEPRFLLFQVLYQLAWIDLAGSQLTILLGIFDGNLGAVLHVFKSLGRLADGKHLFSVFGLDLDRLLFLADNGSIELHILSQHISRSQCERSQHCAHLF